MNFNQIKRHFFTVSAVLCLSVAYGQTTTAQPEDEFAKKKTETKITEVVTTDSLPGSELVRRAANWFKVESKKYIKTSGASGASKAECVVSFPVKPKELNPPVDYTGKVTMKLVIDCKDSKYRFTISDIRHVSKSGRTDGGSVDNAFPDCGSQIMSDLIWKKLRGECIADAYMVVPDIKDGMKKDSKEAAKDDW